MSDCHIYMSQMGNILIPRRISYLIHSFIHAMQITSHCCTAAFRRRAETVKGLYLTLLRSPGPQVNISF